MASGKERLKWERWFDEVTARMERQRKSLDRMVIVNLEFSAALHEIVSTGKEIAESGERTDAERLMQERAQEALDRVLDAATATANTIEGINVETPVSDPRRG